MLNIGGYLNMLIVLCHIAGLFRAEQMFAMTGIGPEMQQLAAVHPVLPYVVTIFVAMVFFLFGLYGLAGSNRRIPLPFVQPGIYIIAAIYLLRGTGALLADALKDAGATSGTLYSAIALFIGLLYGLGGLKRSSAKPADKTA